MTSAENAAQVRAEVARRVVEGKRPSTVLAVCCVDSCEWTATGLRQAGMTAADLSYSLGEVRRKAKLHTLRSGHRTLVENRHVAAFTRTEATY